MRVGLATFGVEEFAALYTTCVAAGHEPVAYVYCRSMKPRGRTDARTAVAVGRVLEAMPAGMDLLLPGTAEGLADSLGGYRLDLLVVYGFNWKLPASALRVPRAGVINVHSSLLPRYRGPAPVLWAIRNGDPEIGLTVHRMDEQFDTGPILAQRGGIPLEEDVSRHTLWQRVSPVLDEVLTVALDKVERGFPGIPQDEAGTSYAGFVEPEFSVVDWSRTSAQVHNQVRMFGFMGPEHAPVAKVGDQWLKVLRTRLDPADGTRAECADGPIWIVESASTEPPAIRR